MASSVVVVGELTHVDDTITASVELVESPFDQLLTEFVHVTDYDTDELVEADLSRSVCVNRFEKVGNILGIKLESEIVKELLEFR